MWPRTEHDSALETSAREPQPLPQPLPRPIAAREPTKLESLPGLPKLAESRPTELPSLPDLGALLDESAVEANDQPKLLEASEEEQSAQDFLVPLPQDALEDAPEDSRDLEGPIVQFDVADFLAELLSVPEPVTQSMPVVTGPMPLPTLAASTAPAATESHGILIVPGKPGSASRLEPLRTLPPWQGNLPPQWAGQNSDWGGRQIR